MWYYWAPRPQLFGAIVPSIPPVGGKSCETSPVKSEELQTRVAMEQAPPRFLGRRNDGNIF